VAAEVSGVIFCASFADFDKPMFEDATVPRINDAIELFGQVLQKEKFQSDVPIFLICNKFDRFATKVTETDAFQRFFPDFDGAPHDVEAAAQFLEARFRAQAGPEREDRPLVVLRQNALDAEEVEANAKRICHFVAEHYFEG
jgi:hypothetical protein